ncbi:acyl-CoA dehydrogenase family protein [Rhodococcus globerulus]|uniref:acyl-CoA dehydrogenase family protein n=1 Tax=Rhodococcus globerulus TaxID=33008 RepID=UPI003015B793
MTVDTSSEHKLFRATTKSFLSKETPISRVRALADEDSSFERSWWTKGAELGWTALQVPEDLGGGSVTGNGILDLVAVAEELGRGVAPGPLHPVNVVLAALVDARTGPDHTKEIEELISGEKVATWAVYEPGNAWAPHAPTVTASATAEGYVLNGVKDRVEAGPQADTFLVTALTDAGPLQFLVDADVPGVSVTRSRSIDLVKQYASVEFDNAEVGIDTAVGDIETTLTLIHRQIQVANLLQVAETVGLLDTVFDFTVQWAFDRYSFGRPLASYQALKHRFADMKMWLEACHATVDGAAEAVQNRADDAGYLVSVAKSYVGWRSAQIIQDCVQMHGGIGITWEHDLHLFLRRALLNRELLGTPEDHRRSIADYLEL